MHIDRVFLSIVGKRAARLSVDLKLVGDGFEQYGVWSGHFVAVTRTRVAEQRRHPLGQHALLGDWIPQVGV